MQRAVGAIVRYTTAEHWPLSSAYSSPASIGEVPATPATR
jgi:hypothetical protein